MPLRTSHCFSKASVPRLWPEFAVAVSIRRRCLYPTTSQLSTTYGRHKSAGKQKHSSKAHKQGLSYYLGPLADFMDMLLALVGEVLA